MLNTITKENFSQTLNRFSTVELENLLEKFPYFQQAHLLLAKKYQLENNSRFDQQLQLAALYTHDRDLFYSVFNEQDAPSLSFETSSAVEEVKPVGVEAQETYVPVVEPVIQVEEKIIETAAAAEEEVKTEEPIEEEPAFVPTAEVISLAQKEELEIFDLQENLSTVPSVSVAEADKEIFNIAEPHTFDEWLKAFAQPDLPKVEVVVAPEQLDEELEKLYLSNMPLDLHELVEGETHYSRGLDKFIEEEVGKKKQIESKPVPNENEIDAELATETMAKIYEAQKKYAKAIQCYEKLGLKYPDKNDFFAARINQLKTLL